jgi:uncharacterized protein (DUF433 family)
MRVTVVDGMAAIATDRYPDITSDPDVQGGAAVVRGTRTPVRAIAFYWRETGDKTRILQSYPQMTPRLLDEALRYYAEHRAEVDEELRTDVGAGGGRDHGRAVASAMEGDPQLQTIIVGPRLAGRRIPVRGAR